MEKKLTIGMATYDDFDGVFFSVQALRMYHPETEGAEIVVLDNNPEGAQGKALKGCSAGCGFRYEPFVGRSGTSSRDELFKIATGKYVIVMDCHVLLAPGAVKSLLDHWAEDPESKDILSGPLLYDDLKNISTHFDPTWRGDMYGTWETNRQAYNEGKAFEIPMMGLGAFACRREAWPGFNEHFVGFGAEEGYIHEKFRINGGRALCIPKFGWNHRFGRPNGVPYRLVLEDRIWNYIVGWMELYKNPEHEMIRGAVEHFKGKVNPQTMEDMVRKARDIYGC